MEQYILFGAGENGRRLLNIAGYDQIIAFADNDKSRWGNSIGEIKILNPEIMRIRNDAIVVVTSEDSQKEMIRQLKEMGIENYLLPSEFLRKIKIQPNENIKKLSGIFAGKRCFIIGTGPSLKTEDLELLACKKEICFASNKIFKIFPYTLWRPNLYCVSDAEVLSFYYNTICELDVPYRFLLNMKNSKYTNLDLKKLNKKGIYLFNIFKEFDDKGRLAFSTNPAKYTVDGGITVTYSMLQWAYFLGFGKVYLLGVDFLYHDSKGKDRMADDHFCHNYIELGEVVNSPKIETSLVAYQSAALFCESHKFEIYNATRGGRLEVFPRVNFDDIFSEY